jgi:glycerol-3-phosphate dehydrogenase (NAD(P)+)
MAVSVGVIGLGSWGTALAHHLCLKGCDVVGWARSPEVVAEINKRHFNPKYLKGVRLCPKLKASNDIEEVSKQDVVLLTFPSSQLANVLPKLKVRSDSLIISAIKGFEPESLLPPTLYLSQIGIECAAKAVLSGPSFARDIAEGRPCGVVLACSDEKQASRCAELFASEAMRVFTSSDVLGVELGGAFKNVIALAAGACDGLGLGESARAGLITRGLAEMMRLAEAMGAQSKTLAGLSGLGDLIMTATSGMSRNHQVGFRLGRGESLPDILNTLGSVAEGVPTTRSVQKLAKKYDVRVTITDHMAMVLDGVAEPKEMISSLIVRPVKPEFD